MVPANGVRARAALGRYCGLVWSAADGVSCRKSPAKHAGVSDLLTLSFIESRAFVVCWRVHHVMRSQDHVFFAKFSNAVCLRSKACVRFCHAVLSFMTKTGATGRICPQSNHSFLVRSIVRVWSNTASAIQCLFLVLEISRFRGSKLGLLQSHTV